VSHPHSHKSKVFCARTTNVERNTLNIHHNHKSHCFDGKLDSVHRSGKYIYIVNNCKHNTLVAIEMTECLCSIIECGDNLTLYYYFTVDLFEVIDLERLDGMV
jgi:hypothetical protein